MSDNSIKEKLFTFLVINGYLPKVFRLFDTNTLVNIYLIQFMKNNFTAIDLFCGCGGLSYGFQKAGFNIALGIDNDPASLETFKYNHKNSISLKSDIKSVTGDQIKTIINNDKIDLIVGGPPCQGMSISGPRKFNDPRNSLYLSFIRLVSEIKPLAFVIENVPGLVKLFEGKIKNHILKSFEDIGYKTQCEILTASDFGVPQKRRRVFFIGLLDDFFNFETDLNRTENIVTSKMAIDDLPSLTNTLGEEIMEYESKPNNEYQRKMREGSLFIYNHVAANHSNRVKSIISLVPDGGNYKDLPDELQKTRNFNVAWTRFNSCKPAPTIDTGHRHHFHYEYNRVPTVRESARLQSFPDVFRFFGNKTAQFRQVGNAVPPLLAEEIGLAILKKMQEF